MERIASIRLAFSLVLASALVERTCLLDSKPFHFGLIASCGKDRNCAGWCEIGEMVDGCNTGDVVPGVPQTSPDRSFRRHQAEAVTGVDPGATWNVMSEGNAARQAG